MTTACGKSWVIAVALAIGILAPSVATAQEVPAAKDVPATQTAFRLPDLSQRDNLASTIELIAAISILSLAPAILLMVTSFTRIIIVLSLLRHGLGAQQLPPNQVLVGLSLFMTFLIMAPTWQRVNNDAVQPYLNKQIDQKAAIDKGLGPIREFMSAQIARAGNDADVDVFTDAANMPRAGEWKDVPTTALIPAFMLSELKVAFAMGFKMLLPFLVIDLVVSMLLVSGGMMMMPPVLVSLPFKLLLFVMVDGWRLITGTLIASFVT